MDSYTSNDLNELSMTGIGSLLGATEGNINDLDARVSTNENLISTLRTDLTVEGNTRASADSTLQTNIDTEETARASADSTLQTNIDTEETARASADSTLQTNITAEATTRANADSTLQTNITAEATTRANADSTLQTNITAEATTRANADSTLQTNITAEATTRASADSTLQTNIDTEETARIAGDALKVNKTGATMTGKLSIQNSNAIEFLNPINPTENTSRLSGTTIANAVTYYNARENHISRESNYDYVNTGDGGQLGMTHRITMGYTDEIVEIYNASYYAPTEHAMKFEVSQKNNQSGVYAYPVEIMRLEYNKAVISKNTEINGNLTVSNPNEIYYKGETLDARFHSLDTAYYTEAESDARFVNVAGDTMTGVLVVNSTSKSNEIWVGADTFQAEDIGIYFTRGRARGITDRHHYITTRFDGASNSGIGNKMKFYIDDGSTATGASHATPLTLTPVGVEMAGDVNMTGDLTVPIIQGVNVSNIHKIRLWSDTDKYSIGMTNENVAKFGGLFYNAMCFTMNNDSQSGFLWRDVGHNSNGSQGVMSLTTDGKLTVARNTRIGYGEATTDIPSGDMLDVNGDVNITGDLTIESATENPRLTLWSKNTGSYQPTIDLVRNSSTFGGDDNYDWRITNIGGTFRIQTQGTISGYTGLRTMLEIGATNAGVNINGNTTLTGDLTYSTRLKSTSTTQRLYTSGSTANWIQLQTAGASGNDILDIKANSGSSTISTRVANDLLLNPTTAGNIGIGTENPSVKLDVNGDVNITGDTAVTGELTVIDGVKTYNFMKDWNLNYTSLSTTYFYAIVFEDFLTTNAGELPSIEFEIYGETLPGTNAYSEETIKGHLRPKGWSSHNNFYEYQSRAYQSGERRLSQIWRGNSGSYSFAVYVRGGYRYKVRTNATNVKYLTTEGSGAVHGTGVYNGVEFTVYGRKQFNGTDAPIMGLGTSNDITLVENIAVDRKTFGSRLILTESADCLKTLKINTDTATDLPIEVNTVPLLTQIHSFYQHDSNNLNTAGFFYHSGLLQNYSAGIRGMVTPCNIKPYAIALSFDGDGGEGDAVFTFQIRYENQPSNPTSYLTTTSANNIAGTCSIGGSDNTAKFELVDSPVYIPIGRSWGLYLLSITGDTSHGNECIAKVYFSQV